MSGVSSVQTPILCRHRCVFYVLAVFRQGDVHLTLFLPSPQIGSEVELSGAVFGEPDKVEEQINPLDADEALWEDAEILDDDLAELQALRSSYTKKGAPVDQGRFLRFLAYFVFLPYGRSVLWLR